MTTIHLSKLDLNLLKVFDCVHRERHITRAARALCISQSAVSHSIAKLRILFGDPLFIRMPNGMQPTALADRLANPISRALQAVGDALQLDRPFDPAAADTEFCIGTTTTQPFHFLPELYRRIEREAPRTSLRIRTLGSSQADALKSLDHGDVDVVLTMGTRDGEGALATQRFMHEKLFEDPLVCVVSRHNDLVGETMDAETYARLPHLVMASDRVTRTWIDDELEARGLRRRIAVTAPHAYAIPLLIGRTCLVSTVACSLVSPFVDQSELRLLTPPISGPPLVFRMIWATCTDGDPALTWLRSAIRDSCSASEQPPDTPASAPSRGGGTRRAGTPTASRRPAAKARRGVSH